MGHRITVTVVANAKKNEIVVRKEELRVYVKAKAQEGKANRELLRCLATYFRSPTILAGHTSKKKVVSVDNGEEEVVFILRELGKKA